MQPIKLVGNRPSDRFYRGGERIDLFRANQSIPEHLHSSVMHTPEDWLGSTTPLFGEGQLGLTELSPGRYLVDAIQDDPNAWLGEEHVKAFGADTFLLVKLLDAGERLPIHAHPNRSFAKEHLGIAHGKTEAWIALTPGEVSIGFSRSVTDSELSNWVRNQQVDKMRDAMNTIIIDEGDSVLVPAGIPHAIGEGTLVVELQESSDLSILLEWEHFAIDGETDGHLGLGYPLALQAIDRRQWTDGDIAALKKTTHRTKGPLLPGAEEFFRAFRMGNGDAWDAVFSVLVVEKGRGTLHSENGPAVAVRRGETFVIPYQSGRMRLEGDLEAILAMPPATP